MFMLFKKCFRKHKLFVQMDTKSLDNTYDKHVAYLKNFAQVCIWNWYFWKEDSFTLYMLKIRYDASSPPAS